MTPKYPLPEMTPPPVASSNIEQIGFDSGNRRLFVRFKGTGLYVYHDFIEKHWKALNEATSIGKHISREVIPLHASEKLAGL